MKELKKDSKNIKDVVIIDTNVILHDPECMSRFCSNDIFLPIIVLEELDKFKKGNETINYNARIFIRKLSKLSDESPTQTEIKLPDGEGTLYIKVDDFDKLEYEPAPNLANMGYSSNDNKLLIFTLNTIQKHTKRKIILITKDVNLRMKARAYSIDARDYDYDKVEDGRELYKGHRLIDASESDFDIVNKLYQDRVIPFEPNTDAINLMLNNKAPISNEYFMFKNGQQSVLARYYKAFNEFRILPDYSNIAGISPKNIGQRFALDALLDPTLELVTITGEAGSGKTLLSLAAAIHQKRNYLQIYMAKPVVPIGNDIGFLPGTVEEKLQPYMESFYDNLTTIKQSNKNKKIDILIENEKIQIAPVAYIRGRSLPRVYFIYDETQSTVKHEIKSVITRAGEGTKVVCMGDLTQIDSPYLDAKSNGLAHVISRMRGEDYYAHVHLDKSERSRLAERASKLL